MRELDAYGNVTIFNLLSDEFIKGHTRNLSVEDEIYIANVKEQLFMDLGYSFLDWSRQTCPKLFVSMTFRRKDLTWKELPDTISTEGAIGPDLYYTDFGACCILIPHMDLGTIQKLPLKFGVQSCQSKIYNGSV